MHATKVRRSHPSPNVFRKGPKRWQVRELNFWTIEFPAHISSFAVNFWFFRIYTRNMASGRCFSWSQPHFCVFKRWPHPLTGPQVLSEHPQIPRQNGRKPVKFRKIHYKSVITQKSVENCLPNSPKFPRTCYVKFAIFRFTIACVVHVLHAVQVAEPLFLGLKRWFTGVYINFRYIEVRIYQAIWFPTRFRVAVRLQTFPCLDLYSILPLHEYKVTMYRNHQQKCRNRNLNFGP